MAKKRKGGRTTPKGTRPPHLRPVPSRATSSPVDDLIDTGARDLRGVDHPIEVETWASGMLAIFERARRHAREAGLEVPPFEEAVLERCLQRRDRPALLVASGFAAVLAPPLDGYARSVAAELRELVAGTPRWLDNVGLVAPVQAWVAGDVFGDQESLILAFSQDGDGSEHALLVLVDHNLSGQAKDAWISAEPDDAVGAWKSIGDVHMQVDEAPVEDVLRRLRDAMAMSDLYDGDAEVRTEDFAMHRGLIWARLRRVGLTDPRPAIPEVSGAEREALVAEFLASSPGRNLAGADVEMLARHVVDLRADHEGLPLRWSPDVVERLLLDLVPRKLLLDTDAAAALPGVVGAFVRFAGERTGLDARFVDETLATIDMIEAEFLDRFGDPSAAGPAKAVLAALQARGVDLDDLDAVNGALEDLGPIRLPEPVPTQHRSTDTAPPEVVAAAAGAPVLARFDTLTAFYGDGRKLTQTGQPTLADARSLVQLLGTEDRFDEVIGAKTFKTRSAAELPELGFTIRWAVAAGALRKERTKLRATAAWAKLDVDPLRRWLKAVDRLPALGPIAGFYDHAPHRSGDELLDDLTPGILHLLRDGPQPYDVIHDWVCERAEVDYEWLVPYLQDRDTRNRSLGWDLDLLTRILGWAGIAERIGATTEPDRYARNGLRLVSGELQLTPVGRWWLTAGS